MGLGCGVLTGGIDGAAHIWSADQLSYPWSPHDDVDAPLTGASAELLLAALDETGLDGAVCVQPRAYGYDHAYLAEVAKQYPERISAVCLVNPVRPSAPRELRRLAEDGFRGLRLIPLASRDATWLAGPEADDVFDAAADLGLPVSVLARSDQLVDVVRRARRSPGATVVVDHLGLIDPVALEESLRLLQTCAAERNVVVKVSALSELSHQQWPYADVLSVIDPVLDMFGPERVVFGTDWPHCLERGTYAGQWSALVEGLDLDPNDHLGLFGQNAKRMWPFASLSSERSIE
jgi:L-fuconolactonase